MAKIMRLPSAKERIPIPGESSEVTNSANELNKQATRFLRIMLDFVMLDDSTHPDNALKEVEYKLQVKVDCK